MIGRSAHRNVSRFGRFSVVLDARLLLCNGRPVELGSRAFDLLAVLIKGRGTVVTKDEIMRYVWPSTIVHESNLRFQMAALRRTLGRDRNVIKTVPGRGYLFAGEDPIAPAASAVEAAEAPRSRQAGAGSSYGRWLRKFQSIASHRDDLPAVFIVIDSDRAMCEALHGLTRLTGLRVKLFGSISEFLARG